MKPTRLLIQSITFCIFAYVHSFSATGETPVAFKLSDIFSFSAVVSDSFSENQVFYSNLKINQNNRCVFEDSTQCEYRLKNTPPKFRLLKNGSYEILFLVSGRPNKDYIAQFILNNNKVLKYSKIASEKDNFPDLKQEYYSATFDYIEMFGDSSIYAPTLVYCISDSGIYLDSAKTKIETIKNLGVFSGFTFNADIHVKVAK